MVKTKQKNALYLSVNVLARKYYMGTLLFLCKIYQEKLFGEVPEKNEDFLDYTNIVWLLN